VSIGRKQKKGMTQKVLLSAAALTTAASLAGLGTYASWTSSASVTQGAVASGSVTIALGATGASTNRLNIGATGLVPGDTIQRSVDLVNTSNSALSGVTVTSTASPSSNLDTDTTNGLKVNVDKCSVAWTETSNAGAAPFTYVCGGATSVVLASVPVIQTATALGNVTLAAGGGTDHLRVTLTFPAAASAATLQNQSSVLSYQFIATQRAGASQ
jgi:predicted ribosomally synthesized peptide with SipW-like signal peptide